MALRPNETVPISLAPVGFELSVPDPRDELPDIDPTTAVPTVAPDRVEIYPKSSYIPELENFERIPFLRQSSTPHAPTWEELVADRTTIPQQYRRSFPTQLEFRYTQQSLIHGGDFASISRYLTRENAVRARKHFVEESGLEKYIGFPVWFGDEDGNELFIANITHVAIQKFSLPEFPGRDYARGGGVYFDYDPSTRTIDPGSLDAVTWNIAYEFGIDILHPSAEIVQVSTNPDHALFLPFFRSGDRRLRFIEGNEYLGNKAITAFRGVNWESFGNIAHVYIMTAPGSVDSDGYVQAALPDPSNYASPHIGPFGDPYEQIFFPLNLENYPPVPNISAGTPGEPGTISPFARPDAPNGVMKIDSIELRPGEDEETINLGEGLSVTYPSTQNEIRVNGFVRGLDVVETYRGRTFQFDGLPWIITRADSVSAAEYYCTFTRIVRDTDG